MGSYSYRVVSFNDGGNSPTSNVASVTYPFNSPTNLLAQSSGSSRIDLTWFDNSLVENGYRIQRKTGGNAFETIATTAAGETAYVDEFISAETTYTYRVLGVHSEGVSSPTNEASATSSARCN